MKYLKTFEHFDQKYLDSILDKITTSGINSLTKLEKDYLNASSGENKGEIERIEKEAGKRTIKSANSYFSFDFDNMEDYGDEQRYFGTIHVPSIEWEDGKKIDGEIEGCIEVYPGGQIAPNFQKQALGHTYDVLEFCNGLEYEFDAFLQQVIGELGGEINFNFEE